MPVAVVPMQFFAPAWIVIVKLSLSHRLPLLFPLAHPRLSEDRIMVRPRELREALFSVCNEKSSEDDRAAWMGGVTVAGWVEVTPIPNLSWDLYGFTDLKRRSNFCHQSMTWTWESGYLELFGAEKGLNWDWYMTLRLWHISRYLKICILLFLVTHLVPKDHANHYLGAMASTDVIVVGLCQLAQRTNWRTTARSRRWRSWTQHVSSFLVQKKWILQNGAQKDAKVEFCLDVVWKLDEVI